MNKKLLFALTFFAIVLLAATFWAKWKQDNPTMTARDAALRQSLKSSPEAFIYQFGTFYHELSAQERGEIAPHIFVAGSTKSARWNTNEVCKLQWRDKDQQLQTIILDAKSQRAYFQDGHSPASMQIVHPKMRRFIEPWMKRQTDIQKQLAKK